jgi:hypothetical protein
MAGVNFHVEPDAARLEFETGFADFDFLAVKGFRGVANYFVATGEGVVPQVIVNQGGIK